MAALQAAFFGFLHDAVAALDRRVGELQLDAHAGGDLQLTGAFRTATGLTGFVSMICIMMMYLSDMLP